MLIVVANPFGSGGTNSKVDRGAHEAETVAFRPAVPVQDKHGSASQLVAVWRVEASRNGKSTTLNGTPEDSASPQDFGSPGGAERTWALKWVAPADVFCRRVPPSALAIQESWKRAVIGLTQIARQADAT